MFTSTVSNEVFVTDPIRSVQRALARQAGRSHSIRAAADGMLVFGAEQHVVVAEGLKHWSAVRRNSTARA
jgi:hypothetical protein